MSLVPGAREKLAGLFFDNGGSVYNVKHPDFGALGNAAADDTVAINSAITTCNLAGGGIVDIPEGTFIIDANHNGGKSIRMMSNVTLRMAKGTKLQVKAGAPDVHSLIYCLNCSDIAIQGGTLIGDRSTHVNGGGGDFGFGVMILTSARVEVRGVYTKNFWGDGIYVGYATAATAGQESTDVSVVGCVSDNNRRQGMSVVAAKRCHVTASSFINTNGAAPGAGIDFEPDVGTAVVQDCTVVGCNFENNAQGVAFAGVCQQITVSGSNFRGHSLYAINFGISCVDCVASNNTIRQDGNTTYGIYLAFNQGGIVTGNIIRGSFLYGIWARGGADYTTVGKNRIQGNRIFGDGTTTQFGIFVNNLCGRNTISANEIKNCGYGINVNTSDWQTIVGNILSANTQIGLFLTLSKYITCTGNLSEANALVGIYLSGQSLSVIANNVSQGNGTDGIFTTGASTDNLITGNLCVGNSQTTTAANDNISVNSDKNVVSLNICRSGGGAKVPRWGIQVGAGTGNRLWWNDTEGGGTTGEIKDVATATKRLGDRGTNQVSADKGDANATLALSDPQIARWDTNLTAARTCTLPALSNFQSYPGMRFKIRRGGGGAFNLTVQDATATLIKAVPAASWCEVAVNDTNNAWLLIAFGAL
jgi:parallel beta-helix repeat protein